MYEVVFVVVGAMAICWSFAMVLVLTLTALVTPTQPLIQPQPALPHQMHNPAAAIKHPFPLGAVDVEQSWNVLVGRRGRFRRLFQHGDEFVCDAQLKCQRSNVTETERSQTRAILDNYRLPPKHSTNFQSDRMVPTGPNPLHNSNRSQVIFP